MARSEAPEVAAPDAWGRGLEVEAGELSQTEAPKVAFSGVPPNAPDADGRVLGFGQLRLNFDVLRKRKGSPSCSGDAFRPLKQRKYVAMDD